MAHQRSFLPLDYFTLIGATKECDIQTVTTTTTTTTTTTNYYTLNKCEIWKIYQYILY